jgi:hypothetical protein
MLMEAALFSQVRIGQLKMMTAAIEKGPHTSALDKEAMEQLQTEVAEKVKVGQAKVVMWDDSKHRPPKELKVSPIAMVPHKSRKFRAILDLSFALRLSEEKKSSVKTAPAGAIDQLGHSLSRIIHAFAQADVEAKVFMAKWDIKDVFWRLDSQEGAEWNFAYVLPQVGGEPIKLVVPTSLQMGWIESHRIFVLRQKLDAMLRANTLRHRWGRWTTTSSSPTPCKEWIMRLFHRLFRRRSYST